METCLGRNRKTALKSAAWWQAFMNTSHNVEEAFILMKNTGGRWRAVATDFDTTWELCHWHRVYVLPSFEIKSAAAHHSYCLWRCTSVRTHVSSHWGLVGRRLGRSLERRHWSSPPWWLRQLKNLPSMQETWVWSLGWEDPLEKGMATHSSILAWRIPWAEEPSSLQSMGSQRDGHNWANNTHTHTHWFWHQQKR